MRKISLLFSLAILSGCADYSKPVYIPQLLPFRHHSPDKCLKLLSK